MSSFAAAARVGKSFLRRRLVAWCLLTVLVASSGGITLAAVGAARRTASVLPRFLHHADAADLTVDLPPGSDQIYRTIARLPGVRSSALSAGLFAFRITDKDQPDLVGVDQILASVDGRFFTSDRPVISAGRLPDPTRADEAFVTDATAHRTGLRVGSKVRLALFDPSHPPPSPAAGMLTGTRATVRVVGIVTMTDEVAQDDIARDYRLVVTPAFFRAHSETADFVREALHLSAGDSAVSATERRISALAGSSGVPSFEDEHDIQNRAQRAIRPTALLLALFGILAALITVLVLGQAIVRQVVVDANDLGVLRAIGFDRREMFTALSIAPLGTIVAGTVGAIAVGIALSPVGPVGLGRGVEPHPGIAIDARALIFGSLLLVVLMASRVSVSIALEIARSRQPASAAAHTRGNFGRRAARLGAVPAVGINMATRAGRRGTSVHASAGAIVLASILLTMAIAFGAGLHNLVDQPRLYGWNWNSALQLSGGYGLVESGLGDNKPITANDLARVPGVAAASAVRYDKLEVDATSVAAIGVRPFLGRVDLALASGRPADSDDEAVLGQSTATHLGLKVHDQITVAFGNTRRRLTVVGTAVFPSLGRVDAQRTGLGEGIELTGPGLARLIPRDPSDPEGARDDDGRGSDNGLIIRYKPGVDQATVTRALQHRFANPELDAQVVGPQRAAELVDYKHLDEAPAALVALLALAAIGSLVQSLGSSVRQRRRDFGLLKALGFTRRQVAGTVAWQATTVASAAIVVGFPLGVVAGRLLWSFYARQVGVLSQPVTPIALLLLAAAVGLLLANAVAGFPARNAARLPPADTLRTD